MLTREDLHRNQTETDVLARDDLYRTLTVTSEASGQEEMCQKMLERLDRLYWRVEGISRKMVGIQCDMAEIGRDFMAVWESTDENGRESSLVPKAVIAQNKDYIHIRTNFCPPKFGVYPSRTKNCKHATTYQDIRSIWHVAIFEALQETPPLPMTKKALVLLVYRRRAKRFDPPNLDTKIILDTLVDFGMLFDDSQNHLTLVMAGKDSEEEEEGTDIYIGNWRNMLPLLPELLAQDQPKRDVKGD